MIQLHPDCLIFRTAQGESIPCSAETVTIELMGEAASLLDPNLVHEAAAAVVHYFKNELGRLHVSIAEFSLALERVLNSLGLKVTSNEPAGQPKVAVTDLSQIACDLDEDLEMLFFSRLRQEFRAALSSSPQVMRFDGLRECVKRLTRAKRWSVRCQELNDQIVIYLRDCLVREGAEACGLIVK